ncbi:hypothetical protein CRD_01033 [Raphidiopsis brookii D9]|uniref:Uncharacterized protein n=1 Tax=Cylindrospermopsis raciborskii CENA302 TaxID=1170768 RepID=A0A9Q5QXJ2_9CYAN|nr:hypothetical protein [Cylindrospermopsis raciborskii]EFA73823.1 hypothetical protein CRD_01033 [Raphidiopsis brookii D9]OPH09960.1 hypothetical protein CENA302_09240 [Cylindrospermopsis raciborskii CENA302]
MLKSVLITLTQEDHQKARQVAEREKTEQYREQKYQNILVLLASKAFLNALVMIRGRFYKLTRYTNNYITKILNMVRDLTEVKVR